jgi:hypothetical protein
MRNPFEKNASKLEFITFKTHVHNGTIKAKTSLDKDSNLTKTSFKIKEVRSTTAIWNPDKEEYEKESIALCERLVNEE